MGRRVYVGDRVRLASGREGIVVDVTTWRDRIDEMSDVEARAFCERCRLDVGMDYKDTWCQVFVRVAPGKRGVVVVQGHGLEILEGRADVG